MAARAPIRAAVRDRLHELLVAHTELAHVDIHRSLAPAVLERTAIVLFEPEQSRTELRDLRGGRKSYRDVFEFDVGLTAQDGHDGPSDAEGRCDELVAALFDVIADDPTLDAAGVGLAGLQKVEMIWYEGPASFPTADGGWVAHAVVRLQAWTETG
jgi:hypothetical protein